MNKFIVFLCILCFVGCSDVTTERQLIAFSNSNSLTGDFFLGCGTIKNEKIYKYLYKRSDGGIMQDYCLILNSVVYEDDSVKPFIKIISNGWFNANGRYYIRNYITIPKRSINREFNLNLD